MAQVIKLRRSSVAGNVPTTAQLGLGELAINTTDGKIYFEKNDGSATIQTIVTTNSQTTGSIEITGHFSGSATSTGSFGYIKSVTHDTATVTSTNVEVTNNIDFEGDISGSAASTASFGRLQTDGGIVLDNGNVIGSTTSSGSLGHLTITGDEGNNGIINLFADDGDDNLSLIHI